MFVVSFKLQGLWGKFKLVKDGNAVDLPIPVLKYRLDRYFQVLRRYIKEDNLTIFEHGDQLRITNGANIVENISG